jgi:hypothetical protein
VALPTHPMLRRLSGHKKAKAQTHMLEFIFKLYYSLHFDYLDE